MPSKKTKTVEQRLTEVEKNVAEIQKGLKHIEKVLDTKLSNDEGQKVYKLIKQYELSQYKGL